jgi:uncharacterized protein
MWSKLAAFVLRYKLPLLIFTIALSVLAGWFATKVQLSYEFAKAIPENHPAYKTYQKFKQRFGDDGNTLAIGIQTNDLFKLPTFNAYKKMHQQLKQVAGVEGVVSIPTVVGLDLFRELDFYPDSPAVKTYPIFSDTIKTQEGLDSAKTLFLQEGIYKGLLYNDSSNAYTMVVRINKDTLLSKNRESVVAQIEKIGDEFGASQKTAMHYSGLPFIRTKVATMLQGEMRYLLISSLILAAIMLLIFFRSISNTILSLFVVLAGVACSLAIMYVIGFKITLLTALLPPLVVVIAVPNCIYFINKYHSAWLDTKSKSEALHKMISSMGIVTLMCNITAAIGFAVFAFTESALLKEFGIVSGLAILIVFVLSFLFIPTILSYLPTPNKMQLAYLNNKPLQKFLQWVQHIVKTKPKLIVAASVVATLAASLGLLNLKQQAFIVDDLPKDNKVFTDLQFFEKNFKGVMPLEIVIEATNKKNSLKNPAKALPLLLKIDSLSKYLAVKPYAAKPLSIAEGVKFVMQAYNFGADSMYKLPEIGSADLALIQPYLSFKKNGNDSIAENKAENKNQGINKLLSSLIDSTQQFVRVSVGLKDIGTAALPGVIDTVNKYVSQLFSDTTQYKTTVTGTSITFNEGSRFIINGLKESIVWAFALIAVCMLLLFRSVKILICSLIPNILPLVITAGIMGFAGVPLKPSTVLVFSVVLGIAIDITIRFLVNYKQQLPHYSNNVAQTVHHTISDTGISIIYTALVLVAGFAMFISSDFGGTFALGWLTALTLLVATITNLLLLPVLLNMFFSKKK